MAFDKEELEQLRKLFDEQRSLNMLDVKALLQPIQEDIENIKIRLDQLYRMINDDVAMVYKEVEKLKKKVTRLEKEVAALKSS